MTASEESKAWRALVKATTSNPAVRKMLVDIAHQVVGSALSAAVVADKRDRLAEYFGLPRMSE
jgi:hypothetical protein